MELSLYQVDAFADNLFEGNPAAVCPLESWLPDELLQDIARENNLSETAFFVNNGESGAYRLRWFTPEAEVDLCGHATLASAHVLFEHLGCKEERIVFDSNSGDLMVGREVHNETTWLVMDFPAAEYQKQAPPMELYNAMGIMPVEVYEGKDYLWVLESEEEVRKVEPDMRKLKDVDTRGVIVTAPGAHEEIDFVSRFFAPAVGVDEDPVTGSTHTLLIPYWSDRLKKGEMLARQVSTRGGTLRCRLMGDTGRVEIAGKAQTFLSGTIILPG